MAVTEARTALVATKPIPFDRRIEVPETPPRSWLDKPGWLEPGQKLTVLASGQAAGYWFQHGTCLVHDPSACPKPSPTGYGMFHQNGRLPVRDEVDNVLGVEVGVIGNVHGHASPRATVQQAQAHYSDPDAAMLIGRCGDDEYGAWFAGCLVPDKQWTGRDLAFLNRCALSGDWRPLPFDSPWWEQNHVERAAITAAEGYDGLGPTLVTRPALPVVRSYPMAASTSMTVEREGVKVTVPDDRPVLLGGLGGIQLDDGENAYDAEDCQDCEEARVAGAATETKPDGEVTASLTIDADAVKEIIEPLADKLDTALGRLDRIEEDRRGERQAAVDELRSRAAAINRPALPAPVGIEGRTMIEYTTADVEWLETVWLAAPAPSPKSAANRPAAQRAADAKSGVALDDGSFPIRNCGDWQNARQAVGRADPAKRAKVQAHIAARGKALGCSTGNQ